MHTLGPDGGEPDWIASPEYDEEGDKQEYDAQALDQAKAWLMSALTNTKGGVRMNAKGQWATTIYCKGKSIHVGVYADKNSAVKARKEFLDDVIEHL